MSYTWTQSNGGPLVLLEAGLLPAWKGLTNVKDPLDPATDYGRACAVSDYVGVIPLGQGVQAVVLGGDPTLPATWGSLRGALFLARTYAGDEAPQLAAWPASLGIAHAAALGEAVGPLARVHPTRSSHSILSDRLCLFDAAFPGEEALSSHDACEERLPALLIPCNPGTYSIVTVDGAVDGEDVLFHFFLSQAR